MKELAELAQRNGFSHFAPLNMHALTPLEAVREMCAADRCGCFGQNWACPPGCGSLEHVSKRLSACKSGVLVQTTGTLADEFDYDGITALMGQHRRRFTDFARQVRLLYPDCLPLSAGPCLICHRCTYPHRPCRFPNKRISSMEAYGLLVSDVCIRSGLQYNYGPNTLTYTSCVLFTKE